MAKITSPTRHPQLGQPNVMRSARFISPLFLQRSDGAGEEGAEILARIGTDAEGKPTYVVLFTFEQVKKLPRAEVAAEAYAETAYQELMSTETTPAEPAGDVDIADDDAA